MIFDDKSFSSFFVLTVFISCLNLNFLVEVLKVFYSENIFLYLLNKSCFRKLAVECFALTQTLEAAFDEELADEVLVVALDNDLALYFVDLRVDVHFLVFSLEQVGFNVFSQVLVELL